MVFEKLSAIAKKSTERAVVTRVFAYDFPSFDKLSGYLRGGLRSVMLAFDGLAVSPTMPVCILEFGRGAVRCQGSGVCLFYHCL